MNAQGQSLKMTANCVDPIEYSLRLGSDTVVLNHFIGKRIKLTFLGTITCIACGRKTRKSFAQGFCYPCMQNSAQNSECIIRPELCRGHLGEGRDPEWERANHVCEHVVYLAASSQIKVGVTRADQVPTRWIDQGASQALVIARTPHRFAAGQIEVALKEAFTDRTSWQKMLKNDVIDKPDWPSALETVQSTLPDELHPHLVENEQVWSFNYPVNAFPTKVKSQSFDKTAVIEGTLNGIKGQYLLLDDDRVLNIRKHNGYELRIDT